MSSTTGSQNLLTNILRPVYRYEVPTGGSTAMFTPRLDVCNIDVLSANSVTAFTAAIADENENVYVGLNAGNDYSNLRGCSNVTAVGYSAANMISNVKNSVYLGYNSGSGATDSSVNVAIGPNTKGNGISNIYIGSNTGSLGTGSNNILIGHNLTGTNLSNTLLIGPTPTIYGNLSTRKVGIGRDPSYNMDISGDSRISYRLGIGMAPGSASNLSNLPHALDVSGYTYINGALGINSDPADYTMNVNGNFNVNDGNGSLRLTSDGSGNSVIEARSYGGKRLLFNIQGDLCANSIIIPGGTFPGNLTASNVITLNDLSGPTAHVTNIYGTTVFGEDVSGTTARFGTLYANTFTPASITVANLYAGNGTVSAPPYTFSNDASSGVYLPSATNVAITAGGVERLRVTNTHVGIGTTLPRSALDVSTNIRAGTPGNTSNTARLEVGGGYMGDGATTSNSYPAMAFQYGDPTGGYRHFIRSRHTAATTNNSNAIDIFTNNSTTASASTAPATNNLLAMSITSGGVGIGLSNPTFALDVSGAIRSTGATSNSIGGVALNNSNITYSGAITNSTASNSNVIGGVTLVNSNITYSGAISNSTASNSNVIGGVTLVNSNIAYSGTISNSTATSSNSIGGVTLSNRNIDASGILASNVVLSNTANGFIRNAATGFTIDLSGGRVRTAVGAVNNPAFGFLATDICAGMYLAASNQLGIAVAGTARLLVDNSSVQVGNPSSTAKTALLEIAGGYQGTGAVVSTSRFTSFPALALQWGDAGAGATGGFRHFIRSRHDLQLLTSTNAIDFFTNNGTTAEASAGPGISNVLAMSVTSAGVGIGLSNPAVALDVSGVMRASNAAANAGVVAGFVRNALTPSTYDISGGNISNSATTISSNFLGTQTASNTIGGVVLSNGLIRSDASDTFVVGLGVGTATMGYSTDGTSWTPAGSIFSSNGNGLAWNGNLWVATGVGALHSIATSSNGTSWTGLGLTTFSVGGNGVAWNGSIWVAVGAGTNTIATSTDGSNWTGLGTGTFSSGGNKVAWNGRLWVAVGAGTNTIAYSPDGSNWVGLGTSIFSSSGTSIAWNGSLWVAGGTGTNSIATSPDGITWTGRGTSTFSHMRGLAWNGKLWVATGETTNTIATSTDGITWTGQGALAPLFTVRGYSVTWTGSLWVAFGEGGNRIISSPDGSTWTGRTPSNAFTTRALAVSARRYILPVVDSIITDASGGNIELTGAITGSNSAASNRIGGVLLQSSNVQTGAGNVRNPTHTFITDPSAGLYLPAASNLGFTIAGVERARLDSNGALGIGTTAPLGRLDVINGGIVMNRIGNITATTDVSAIVEGSCNVGLYWQKGSNNNNCGVSFKTLTNNVFAERMRIDANTGRVGIGTSNPQSLLDVSSITTSDGVYITAPDAQLRVRDPSNAVGNHMSVYQSGTGQGIFSSSAIPFHIWTFGSIRMSVSADGNVGIGTSNQGYRLDVTSDSTAKASINMTTWPRLSTSSNTTIVRGTAATGAIVGNTINWSNAQQNTISTNLMTLVLSNAAGCSFKINRSGIWSISWVLGVSNGFASWIDASTNENSNVALGTTGTYIVAFANTGVGTITQGSWTGYLPSNASTFYKVRTNSAALTLNANSNYFMATFLTETSNAGGNFPFN
jgi:hypothetical protein